MVRSYVGAFVLAFVLGALGGTSCHGYSCNYKGHEYHTGDTWTDGCMACHCPAEGTKDTWCYPCSDGGADADAGTSD
jgi:hypothetical protein